MRRYRLGGLLLAVAGLAGCRGPDRVVLAPTPPPPTVAPTHTALPTAAPVTPTPVLGDVAALLARRPPPGTTVEIDAYFSGTAVAHTIPMSAPGTIACPALLSEVALTDRPFPGQLQSQVMGLGSNPLPPGAEYLLATVPEALVPDSGMLPELPFHARFRGYLGEPKQAHCMPNAERIFVVDQIVTVYTEDRPADQTYTELTNADLARWQTYRDPAGYSLRLPADWTVEPASDARFVSTVRLHAPQWPKFPVTVRVWDHEMKITEYVAPDPPALQSRDGFGLFSQWHEFAGGPPEGAQLTGYAMDREVGTAEREQIAILNVGGRAYELAIRYPTGFDAPLPLLSRYSTIVETLRVGAGE